MSFPEPEMAKIRSRKSIYSIQIAGIALIIFYLVLPIFSFSVQDTNSKQTRKKIELLYCDELVIDKQINKDLYRLIGNVGLKHNDLLMTCDSAYWYRDNNQVKAFSKVKINQGDTLTISGDYLFYDGNFEKALISGNVELTDKETKLYTSTVNYDAKTRVADYPFRGKIINGENTLTSRIGIYYALEKKFHFNDSVFIVNPDYIMRADSLEYNTETGMAYFISPTVLEGDSLYIYCEKGWYDTKNDITSIWQNSVINNRKQIVRGDSLFYNNKNGFGQAFNNISITDTSNNVILEGNYAWSYKEPERFMVTDSALFIQVSNEDSLFLHADTISAATFTAPGDTSSWRLMKAYYGCKVFSYDIQARCDSLSYSFRDSVIRLYYSPILWSKENQLTADSMAIFTKDRKAESMELYNSVFVVSQVDSLRFNQMKGRKLTGYFIDNKLRRIVIEGNAETIYFMVDNDGILGINYAKSSSIEILFENGKVNELIEYQNPDGKLDPPEKNSPENYRLPGFAWHDTLRPKKKSDVFL